MKGGDNMTGWKTWVAGIGGICSGIGISISGLLSDPLDPQKIYEGILIIAGGLGLIGIGHKIEKKGL